MDFCKQLIQSRSYGESFQAYDNYIHASGCQGSSYTFIPDAPFTPEQEFPLTFSISDNFNHDFLEEYQNNNFQASDYVLEAVKQGQERKIFLWKDDIKQISLNPSQRNVIEVAQSDYDMKNSFSILTPKSKQGIGAFTIIGDATDRLFSQYIKEQAAEFYIATETFNNHILARSYEAGAFTMPFLFSKLSKTERQVLKRLIAGLSVPRIAEELSRSRGYIENVVRNIRIKLGGRLENGKPKISKDRMLCFCSALQIYDEL
jgi:hypothetical protein